MATVYTTSGEGYVVDLIDGTETVHLDSSNSYVEWGTGVTTAAKGDTDIETAGSEARVLCTASQPLADKNQWVGTITADGAIAVTEAALFSHLSAGTLIIRGDFTVINLTTGDKIEFTISLEQT